MNIENYSLYDVVIVGGGPVGAALAIELGLNNIKTLVIEKYGKPLLKPRAQSLSARTMEFFMRWGIDRTLENSTLLPLDFPAKAIWCSKLNGESYYSDFWGDNKLDPNVSPKQGVRIPLWITEKVLRDRIKELPSVEFLTEYSVENIELNDHCVKIASFNKSTQKMRVDYSRFLACCDGVNGISKSIFNNPYEDLTQKNKILSVNFISHEISEKKTLTDAMFYCVLSKDITSFIGPIDLKTGLWFAQIIWNDNLPKPNNTFLSQLLDKICGYEFDKTIQEFHFWDMQVQLAQFFRLNEKVFWLGDAAHAFAPTGGLGVNTGFGDAVNLGWKLAAVIKKKNDAALLETYEIERRAVCQNNLNFAKQMSEEVISIKKRYPPEENYQAFAKANAELGTKFLSSSGLTLGYVYDNSPLTCSLNANIEKTSAFQYIPITKPGYFLPHATCIDGQTIYHKLSSTHWNLVICGQTKAEILKKRGIKDIIIENAIMLIEVERHLYPYRYLLLRPDWHIAKVGNNLEDCLCYPYFSRS